MTSQSAVPDYISIILRAIEKAQNDPAQLRQLVYDIARIGFGKQVLLSYREIGSAGLQQQVSDLEAAIKQVEIIARLEGELLPHDSQVPLIEGPVSSLDRNPVIIRDQIDNTSGHRWNDNTALVAGAALPLIYRENATTSEFLPSTRVWEQDSTDSPRRIAANRFRRFELPIAVLIGIAIYAVTLVKTDYLRGFNIPALGQITRSAELAPPATAPTHDATASLVRNAGTQKLDFPLPSIYGVYAVSEGRLYELEPLAMKVPDPRVAISAMISSPSRVTVPNGKLAFIVYRRDLVSSAPDSVPIRIMARVMRELKFSEAGPPKSIQIKGEWAVRSKSFEFGVAPLKNNPEMIMLRPQNPQFSLSPGRYALVFRGQGYDFSVAGQMTDAAQCLERTDALGGMVYSECPSVPSAPAN